MTKAGTTYTGQMKVVVLAGGLWIRLSEEAEVRPKPLVEIGARPILWHIVKGHSAAGFHRFAIALGHRGHYIKEFYFNYTRLGADLTISTPSAEVVGHGPSNDDWTVDLVETGLSKNPGPGSPGRPLAAR